MYYNVYNILQYLKCNLFPKTKMTKHPNLGGTLPTFITVVPLSHGVCARRCCILLWHLWTLVVTKCLPCGTEPALHFLGCGGATFKSTREAGGKTKHYRNWASSTRDLITVQKANYPLSLHNWCECRFCWWKRDSNQSREGKRMVRFLSRYEIAPLLEHTIAYGSYVFSIQLQWTSQWLG